VNNCSHFKAELWSRK